MAINRKYFNAIKPCLNTIRNEVNGDFVLFGSATLYLLGITKFTTLAKMHDLDVTLKGTLKNPTKCKIVHFEGDPSKKFYKMETEDINIDIGTPWPGEEYWFNKVFENPIVIEGFKFANLETVLEYKKRNIIKYNREKDRIAVGKIENYLKKANT